MIPNKPFGQQSGHPGHEEIPRSSNNVEHQTQK